jgi:uncharacterized protein (DUF1499 family)
MADSGEEAMSGSETLGQTRNISDGFAKLAIVGLIVALGAGLAQAFAGPGRQLGYWDHNFGFRILEWGGYAGLVAAGASLIGLFFAWGVGRHRLTTVGVFGVLLGAVIAYWPWAMSRSYREPPPLYDITTDTANPPPFVAALELRKGARLPAEYPASFASEQLQAYPNIKPMIRRESPQQAFARALRAARAMGWNVHTIVPEEGRIEAVAKTLWFGFEDDVVIRVTALENGGSRIDVRSTGRLGRRDGGTNAKRVKAYLEKLNSAG